MDAKDVLKASKKFSKGEFRFSIKEIEQSIKEVGVETWTNEQLEVLRRYNITPEKLVWLRTIYRSVDKEQIGMDMRGPLFYLFDHLNWISLEATKLIPTELGMDKKIDDFQYALKECKYKKIIPTISKK